MRWVEHLGGRHGIRGDRAVDVREPFSGSGVHDVPLQWCGEPLGVDGQQHQVVGVRGVVAAQHAGHLLGRRAVDEALLLERAPEGRPAVLAGAQRLLPVRGLGEVQDGAGAHSTPSAPSSVTSGHEVGDRVDDAGRPVGEVLDLLGSGRPGRDEHGAQPRLEAADDVGVHPVADHDGGLGVRLEPVEGAAHHQRVGLADEVGPAAGGGADQRGDRAGGGQQAGGARAARVGVGRDEPRAAGDQPDRLGDGLERVGAGLAEHDVVGVAVGHHVADVVHRGGQPGLADDVRRAAGALVGEEVGGGEGGGPDRVLGDVDPAAQQPGPQVTGGVDRVVGQHEEGAAGGLERLDELRRPGDGVVLVHEDAVHVGEPGVDPPGGGHAPHCGRRCVHCPVCRPPPSRIRPAVPGDVPVILRLVRELAEYEKALHEVDASEAHLGRRFPGRPGAGRLRPRRRGRRRGRGVRDLVPVVLDVDRHARHLARGPLRHSRTPRFGPGAGAAAHPRRDLCRARVPPARVVGARLERTELGFYESIGAVAQDEWTRFRLDGGALDALAEPERTGQQV